MDRTVTRVVHVKHLAGYILKKWRILLLGMLIGVCAFSVVGVVTIKKSQQQSQVAVEKKKKITVTEVEFASVQGIIDFEEMLEEKEAYMKNSILMQIDPLSKWSCNDVYTVTYLPPTVEMETVEGAQTKQNVGEKTLESGNVPEKVNAMVGLFSEQSFWERLSNKTEDKMDVGYLREIVNAAVVTADKFRVVVVHVNEQKARELADLVEQCLMEIAGEDSRFEDYDLMNEKGAPIESVDNNLVETQKNAQIQLMGIREGLVNREMDLTDSARAYLELYRNAKDQEDYESGQALEKIISVENKVLFVSLKTMKPYMLRGCLIGLLCVVTLLVVGYCFHPCILNPVDANELFGLRILNGKLGSIVRDEEYQMIAAKIDVNIPEECKAEIKVLITGSVANGITETGINNIKKKMETLGIDVIQSDFLKENPMEMKWLKQAEQVVLVEQLGKTSFENLAWEVYLCEESNKKIAGIVFV